MEKKIELSNASHKALKEYMGLKPDETLLIVTDEVLRDIGVALLIGDRNSVKKPFWWK